MYNLLNCFIKLKLIVNMNNILYNLLWNRIYGGIRMNHIIVVKFKENIINKDDLFEQIKILFEKSVKIEGVYKVKIHKNIIEFPNRYDLMIDIKMEKESLEIFDNSEIHHIWKKKYSDYINSKIIFDY